MDETNAPDWAASLTVPEGGFRPDWLRLVWECNKAHTGMFGEPKKVSKVEYYDDAEITFTPEGDHRVVTVRATSPFGAHIIRQAAGNLGLILNEEDK